MTKTTKTTQENTVTRTLRVVLSDAELLEAGKAMADAQERLSHLEGELDDYKKQSKSDMTMAETQRAREGDKLSTGHEQRPVECTEVLNFKTGRVVVTRNDTRDIVDDRAMLETEKQLGLSIME